MSLSGILGLVRGMIGLASVDGLAKRYGSDLAFDLMRGGFGDQKE